MSSNLLHIALGVIAVIGVLLCLYLSRYFYNKNPKSSEFNRHFKKNVNHDTIYFRVTDEHGKRSYIHDSGIKPNTLPQKLHILKEEYNDGNLVKLSFPSRIEYGRNIHRLNNTLNLTKNSPSIEDKEGEYVVELLHIS